VYAVASPAFTSVEDITDVNVLFTLSDIVVGVDETGHPHPMQAAALSLISLLHSEQLISATCQSSINNITH